MFTPKTKAGIRRSYPLGIGAAFVAALTLFLVPHWSMWLLFTSLILMGAWAFSWGYRHGPFWYRSPIFKRIEAHWDELTPEELALINDTARDMCYIFSQHFRGYLGFYLVLGKTLNRYNFVVADLFRAAGKHYRASSRIEINYRNLDRDTIAWEIGHALMWTAVEMGYLAPPPVNQVEREKVWLKYRQENNLM